MPRWGAMDRSSRAAGGTSAASTIPIAHRSSSGSRRWREDSCRSRCGGASLRLRRGRLAVEFADGGMAMRRLAIVPLLLLPLIVSAQPYRVGGDVKAPVAIVHVDPVYPQEARQERVSGVVILGTVIDHTGAVKDIKVLKGLPHGLSEAAVD